jgi:hypothetical protein
MNIVYHKHSSHYKNTECLSCSFFVKAHGKRVMHHTNKLHYYILQIASIEDSYQTLINNHRNRHRLPLSYAITL